MEPFLRAPKLVLVFSLASAGQRFRLPIPLPVPMSRFVTAIPFNRAQVRALEQGAWIASLLFVVVFVFVVVVVVVVVFCFLL